MTLPDADCHHLLVVDDDKRLRTLLQRYLVRKGYRCSCAPDAQHAIQLMEMLRFDLIVMDIMMAGIDGIELTSRIRRTQDVPIIILSAKTALDDRVVSLNSGADDYIMKPFEPTELVARIEAILRRAPSTKPPTGKDQTIKFGTFEFDATKGQLSDNGTPVHLTEFELKLLRRLAQAPNRAVSREDFMVEIDKADYDTPIRTIDVRVSRLRQKLEVNPRRPRFLLTVRNKGYMLVPD